MVALAETSIWERVIEPSWDDLTPEAAQAILKLRFKQTELDRMHALAVAAQEGSLSADQQREFEIYNRIGHVLGIMQSKARMALRKPAGR